MNEKICEPIMDEKIIVALVAIIVSWLFAQMTEYVKYRWAGKKTKNGLVTELSDIQNQLQRISVRGARQLQVASLKGMEPSSSLPVANMFYTQYFKDAFAHLNREQRISYQLIHSSLESLNTQNESLIQFFEESYKDLCIFPDDEKKEAIIKVWRDRVIASYKNTMIIRWHINYHLNKPESPSFDIMGEMHESYVKFLSDLDQDVKEIMKNAKNKLNIKDFEVIYDKTMFEESQKSV